MWGRPNSQEVGFEAAILDRVRNSSLVECPRADNGSGLKPRTETVDGTRSFSFGRSGAPVVGERSDAVKGDPGGRLECSEVRMPV
jgi:hypothetical protein